MTAYEAVQKLIGIATDESIGEDIRHSAIQGLGHAALFGAREALVGLLDNAGTPRLRGAAAVALGMSVQRESM
ncbi:hypothetical protein [Cupriavidus sp. UGS-1]|uniref:hypothetical protein n=1 Tax=Cupriavidus sp. UGS-1 TaxID=2899826 RepID=UPI001E32C0D8|nr:hypothetical protein [Cupriavidus sp. UGS-1]MCD9124005.1 hypothetical protein [Cupriavidus sp. UGS-1]